MWQNLWDSITVCPQFNTWCNNSRFGDFVDRIYPIELEIKDTTYADRADSYLDEHLEIDSEGRLRTKLHDKRYDFNFPIVSIPFICSNILAAPVYGVCISQLIRYTKACCSYHDFLDRGLTVMEYICHKWPRICSTWRTHFPVLSSFMTYHQICNLINKTGATSRRGTAYPSEALEFILGLQWRPCYSIYSFMCMFCRSLFVLVSFFFWPLCRLFYFDLRILSTPLVSLNSSYNHLILSPRHVFITLPYQNQLRSPIDQLVYTGYPKSAKVAYGPTGVHRVSKIS
jgi:hypothetical protein